MEAGAAAAQPQQPAANPFASSKGLTTTKFCIWDVLKDKPKGLTLANLVAEIEHRNLKGAPFKNPVGTVGWGTGACAGTGTMTWAA